MPAKKKIVKKPAKKLAVVKKIKKPAKPIKKQAKAVKKIPKIVKKITKTPPKKIVNLYTRNCFVYLSIYAHISRLG